MNSQDTTDRNRLKEMLLNAHKMEALAQLTAGTVHDFNNILTVILGNAEWLKMKCSNDGFLEKRLDQIIGAAKRGAHLSRRMLAFSRKPVVQVLPCKPSDIVNKLAPLLVRLVPEDIKLRIVTKCEGSISADTVQTEQIIMNLVVNARDAMPAGGVITIGTDEMELDENFLLPHGGPAVGRYVRISVTDTGIGIPGELRQKIFDPFFTTKEVGKGTGLGLAITYDIVRQHEGHIEVRSEVGKGTGIGIYLPMIDPVTPLAADVAASVPLRGSETILLAEDEPMLRDIAKLTLEKSGYLVVTAKDGRDAVEKFLANSDRIRLLLLDFIMPRMNGTAAYKEIKKICPDITALFISGYPEDYLNDKGVEIESFNFILKPFTPGMLLKKVREVLDHEK